MKPLSNSYYDSKMKPVFDSVFKNEDPFNTPFKPKIESKLLLFSFRYGVEPPWSGIFKNALNFIGEEGFYLSILSNQRPISAPCHWYVSLNEIEDYVDKIYTFENAIYSVNGAWGLICSHEDHAIIGGPSEFIKKMESLVPDMDERVNDFLKAWEHYHNINNVDISWIVRQLEHIFGLQRTVFYLKKANLEWLLPPNQL